MAVMTRSKSSSKWADAYRDVSQDQAQELLQAMAAIDPVRYQPPLSDNEEETWDKLLKDID